MEKKLVARINEIGQEVGYPYQVLKNGQYQVFDENASSSDIAMVVYGPIPIASRLVEMKKISEDERLVWADLFPNRKEAKDAILTDEEQMKLIIFGRRRTVVNYFKKRNFSKRVARAMVARNDDLLLIEMAIGGKNLPCYLAEAVVKYMSDQRFERFINLSKQKGLNAFSEVVEKKLVKEGRESKFGAYVKLYTIAPSTQYAVVHDKKVGLLKTYVESGQRFCEDIENGLKFIDSLKDMNKIYKEMRKDYLEASSAKQNS